MVIISIFSKKPTLPRSAFLNFLRFFPNRELLASCASSLSSMKKSTSLWTSSNQAMQKRLFEAFCKQKTILSYSDLHRLSLAMQGNSHILNTGISLFFQGYPRTPRESAVLRRLFFLGAHWGQSKRTPWRTRRQSRKSKSCLPNRWYSWQLWSSSCCSRLEVLLCNRWDCCKSQRNYRHRCWCCRGWASKFFLWCYALSISFTGRPHSNRILR